MATQLDRKELDLQEQIARIAKIQDDIDRTRAETVRMTTIDHEKVLAEIARIRTETELLPRTMIFQALIAMAALLGAGAAIAKLFFP